MTVPTPFCSLLTLVSFPKQVWGTLTLSASLRPENSERLRELWLSREEFLCHSSAQTSLNTYSPSNHLCNNTATACKIDPTEAAGDMAHRRTQLRHLPEKWGRGRICKGQSPCRAEAGLGGTWNGSDQSRSCGHCQQVKQQCTVNKVSSGFLCHIKSFVQ